MDKNRTVILYTLIVCVLLAFSVCATKEWRCLWGLAVVPIGMAVIKWQKD